MGNRLAAYYGLYYYPEMNEEEFNWHHTVTVDDKPFIVRMRAPNPAYKIEGKKLYVNEPAHKGAPGTDGFLAKFEFPPFEPPSRKQGIPWNALARPSDKDDGVLQTILVGWAGFKPSQDIGPGPDTFHPMSGETFLDKTSRERTVYAGASVAYFINYCDPWAKQLRGSTFEGRMYDRMQEAEEKAYLGDPEYLSGKGELNFGWSYPRAIWLYPHFGDAGPHVEGHPELEPDETLYHINSLCLL